MENEQNLVEDESISDLINESFTEYNSDEKYISTNALEEIWDRKHVHPNINARYFRLILRDQIRKAHSEWKGAELSTKRMGKVLHKVFKVVVKELNN